MTDMTDIQRHLSQAIDACNELTRMCADLYLAKGDLEREVAKAGGAFEMAAESRALWKQRAIDAGWHPHPGWLAQEPPADGIPEPWNPTGDEGNPASLGEAVAQALGTASMCWENIRSAGVFDEANCRRVYDGLMAYLADWADEHRRLANEATAAKLEEAHRVRRGSEVHQASRGSDVAEWIKRHREMQRDHQGFQTPEWRAVDDLLEDYRGHADTGTPLADEVQGPHPEEPDDRYIKV